MWSLFAAMSLFATGAWADSHEAKIQRILLDIRVAIVQQDMIDALRASNKAHEALTQADIARIIATWQAELESPDHPLISSVVENPLAVRMRKLMDDSGGLINEIGVIGADGLEIAQTNMLSDYWQGEDERFNKTFRSGPNAKFIDLVEYDGPTQSVGSQANFTVADPDTGEAIGSITINFNLASLE